MPEPPRFPAPAVVAFRSITTAPAPDAPETETSESGADDRAVDPARDDQGAVEAADDATTGDAVSESEAETERETEPESETETETEEAEIETEEAEIETAEADDVEQDGIDHRNEHEGDNDPDEGHED